MPTIRTFIAIELPNAIRAEIARVQAELRKANERIAWTKPGNIHLTLKFLGEVEQERIPAVGQALVGALNGFGPFRCGVKTLGVFPNFKRPRVLWVGVENETGEVIELAKKIEEALIHLGFSKENRKFTPHLTLGRVKAQLSGQFIQKYKQTTFDGGPVPVSEVVLIKSDLKPGGAVYTPLQRISLAGGNS